MFVCPLIPKLKPNPQCDVAFGRWVGHEGGVMSEINSLTKETHKDAWPHPYVRELESKLSPDTKFAGILILDFLASRVMRNNCLSYKPPGLWYFVRPAPED